MYKERIGGQYFRSFSRSIVNSVAEEYQQFCEQKLIIKSHLIIIFKSHVYIHMLKLINLETVILISTQNLVITKYESMKRIQVCFSENVLIAYLSISFKSIVLEISA